MVVPIGKPWQFARQDRQLTLHEIAEAETRGVDILAVAEDEIHRHVEHVIDIAFIAEAILEHEGQHTGARRIGIGPDMAPVRHEAVGAALGKGRGSKERGRERLKCQAHPELLHHVGLARIVEVGLDGAGAQHHVEPHAADARHMVQHDLVAALGHDRQFGARLVGPHADAEEAEPELGADFLDLLQVAAGFGAGLMQIFERRARQFKLARGFQADGAVAARERDDMTALDHRLPAEARERHQKVADAAGFVVARRPVIAGAIDEFLVLGADPPPLLGLFALDHGGRELVAAFDDGIVLI